MSTKPSTEIPLLRNRRKGERVFRAKPVCLLCVHFRLFRSLSWRLYPSRTAIEHSSHTQAICHQEESDARVEGGAESDVVVSDSERRASISAERVLQRTVAGTTCTGNAELEWVTLAVASLAAVACRLDLLFCGPPDGGYVV